MESGVTSLEKPEYYGTAQWDKGSVSTGRANIPTITTSVPRSIPLNQLLPKDEYSIIENDDDEDAASSKADAASIAASSDSTILNKTATNAVVQSDSEAARRPSTGSRSATPTIWETYKILGQQYTRFSSAKRRKSSTHSLEILLKKKQEEEFKKHSTALSLPDVDVEFNTALPPLPTVSVPQGKRRQLSRTDSKKSISSAKSEQSMKLAEMLGVSQPSIPEESIEAIAESTAADVINTVQRQIPFTFGSIPSTPDIQKAAENAVTDALRNVIGPQYDPKLSELQVAERLQTTTKASPTGSREDLPVIGKDTARTSTVAQKRRPGSGTSNKSRASNRSRTTLPSPTIEPNAEETTANLDAVAEALSQLPPIPVPSLPRLDGKVSSNTSPSTARKKKRPTSPKTARSLTSEKSIKFSSDSPKSARKTIASSLKEKPPMSKKKMQSSNPKSEEPGSVSQLQPISPKTARKPPSTVVLEPSKPITAPTFEKSKNLEKARNRLPPIYRQSSSTSLKPKRVSSNPPTRQLSNISERSENVQMQGDTSSINKIPISLPSTARGSNKTSKLPQLTDPKKANSVFCRCDTPEYMVADLDLDLPGPYMIPASSIEDLKRVGVSRLPRITSVSRSEPSSERLSKQNSLLRQSSTKSEDLWKSSRLPPIDVDLEDETAQDFDIDTSRIEKSEKYPTSTIARKIATRKAAGQDYSMKQKKMKMSDELSSQEIQYEYRRSTSKKSHIHDGCIRDQPPWDPTPLKDGEIEQIPLDWNLSRSNSQMSLGSRRTQSQGDLRNVTSLKIYSSISPRNMNEGNKSNSLTNLFHFEAQVPDLDSEWVNNLKTSLKKTNNWLDYD
ncbi:hypothetical protein FO519_006381 [Halicephalobus sp. NKZ332]|nr:hypothetical protein FO519_006381 [Halicephalobus sp. NKZ332]